MHRSGTCEGAKHRFRGRSRTNGVRDRKIERENNTENELHKINEVCRIIIEVFMHNSEEEKVYLGEIVVQSDKTIEEIERDNADLRQKIWKAMKQIKEKNLGLEITQEENKDLREKLEDT